GLMFPFSGGRATVNAFAIRGQNGFPLWLARLQLPIAWHVLHFDLAAKPAHCLDMIGKNHLPDVFAQHSQVMSGTLVFKGTRVPVQRSEERRVGKECRSRW